MYLDTVVLAGLAIMVTTTIITVYIGVIVVRKIKEDGTVAEEK